VIPADFEQLLEKATTQLNKDVLAGRQYHSPDAFEQRVFSVLREIAAADGAIDINPTFHPHAFPDIRANGFGVEVKTTNKDSWLSVGNSVFEGMRDPSVKSIYVIFGKMGGMPQVRWGKYENIITHVRISHAPRFVLQMDGGASLFAHNDIAVTYDQFCGLPASDKMARIRAYARSKLKPGEQLWWLEEDASDEGVDVEVRLYMRLPPAKKLELRAEGALLFPQICRGGRVKNKYNEVAFFFLNHHNVFCPQTRDLFSAGSVAGKDRGGNYLQRALQKIESQMRDAALRLDVSLFEEYWGEAVPPQRRIEEWLRRADSFATDWKPSEHLFKEGTTATA